MSVFHSGKTVVRRLTIPEGFNVHEVRKLLIQVEGLRGNISEPFQEGELLPETYHYSFGDTRNSLVKRIKLTMQSTIKRLWPKREQGLPITKVSQFIILASIVEKETGLNEERRRVAAVFLNRLRLGMPLQSDPTVIYGLTKGRGNLGRPLTRKDLRDSNPFNTYVNKGLPPAPISNPGEESIKAVLNPVESEELYFVANGEGGHFFSKTLKDHNKNVAKWRKSQIDKKVSP